MKQHLMLAAAAALALAGCAGAMDEEQQAGRLPGDPRVIGICEIDNPEPGIAQRRVVFGAPATEEAEERLEAMGCTRGEVEDYTRERFAELTAEGETIVR